MFSFARFFQICWGLVPGFVSWVLGIVSWVLGIVCWVLGIVCWVLEIVFRVLGIVSWVLLRSPATHAYSPCMLRESTMRLWNGRLGQSASSGDMPTPW